MSKFPLKLDYSGKLVVITGAGGLLCKNLASAFARSGAKVAALDLNYEAVSNLATELQSEGLTCRAYQADVLNLDDLESVHQKILKDMGPCHILINGAGGNNPRATTDKPYHQQIQAGDKSFFDLEPSAIDFVFKLNFQGTLLPCQVFTKDMLENQQGCILNISSMNAFTPLTKIPAYSAAKSAVSNFTQWLAVHFAPSNIRCNAIAPGFIHATQNHDLLFNPDNSLTQRSKKILANTPSGRFVEAEELLGASLFLCHNQAASAINGIILPIDCGFSAYAGV